MAKLKRQHNIYISAFGTALLLSLFFTVVSPLGLMVSNIEEIATPPIQFLLAAKTYFFSVLLILFAPILIPSHSFRNIYLSLMCSILIFCIINSLFMFGDYGEFDGRALTIDQLSLNSIIQIFALLSLYIVALFVNKRFFIYLSFVFIFSELVVNSLELYFSPTSRAKTPREELLHFANLSPDKPNYLYIILDQVYGYSTETVFENENLAGEFPGFINYTNTSGIYPTTIVSIPAILTGNLYDSTKHNGKFLREAFFDSPLITKLEDNDFDIKLNTITSYASPKNNSLFLPMTAPAESVVSPHEEYIRMLNFTIFKAAPDLLKPYLYKEGSWNFSVTLEQTKPTEIREFDFLSQNLQATNPSQTFRLYHSFLTHSPVKYDKSCNFLNKPAKPTEKNFIAQDTCGFSQVVRILRRLKELDVYDNTYIIISSDHGRRYGVPKKLKKKFSKSRKVPQNQYGLAHATLMVKPFNSKEKFRNDHTPMSLLDIAPLVMANIDGTEPEFHPERRTFFNYPWHMKDFKKPRTHSKNLPPVTKKYYIGEDIRNPADWAPAAPNEYKLNSVSEGDRIFFGQDGENTRDKFMSHDRSHVEGFGKYEEWGRWSNSKNAAIRFKLHDSANVKIFSLELVSETSNDHPQQTVEILLNGSKVGEVNFSAEKPLQKALVIEVPSDLMHPGDYNELQIRHENNVHSKNVNNPKVGIKSLTFG